MWELNMIKVKNGRDEQEQSREKRNKKGEIKNEKKMQNRKG